MSKTTLALAFALLPGLSGVLAAQDTEAPKAKPATPMRAVRIQAAPAQTEAPTQDSLVAKFEEKLGKPFMKAANWTTDYDAARARCKAEGKLLFGYFTRSYAH